MLKKVIKTFDFEGLNRLLMNLKMKVKIYRYGILCKIGIREEYAVDLEKVILNMIKV